MYHNLARYATFYMSSYYVRFHIASCDHRVTIADKINIFLLLETRRYVRYYFNTHIQHATLRHVVSLTTSFYIFSLRIDTAVSVR